MENIQHLNKLDIDQLRKHWIVLREDFIIDILNNMSICDKINGGLLAYKINNDYVFLYSPLTNNVFISNSSAPIKVVRFISPPLKFELIFTLAPSFTNEKEKAIRAIMYFSSFVSALNPLISSSACCEVYKRSAIKFVLFNSRNNLFRKLLAH